MYLDLWVRTFRSFYAKHVKSPTAYLKDGACNLPKILFSSLQLKLFDIAQRWAQKKDAKQKKLLNLLCIVYVWYTGKQCRYKSDATKRSIKIWMNMIYTTH